MTNNALAYQYEEQMHGTIICTGGTYTKLTRSYVGELAADLVNKVYADICILGVNGIDSVRGVTTAILQETMINQNMVNRCLGPVIVVADGSKIGKTFSLRVLICIRSIFSSRMPARIQMSSKIPECGN